MSRQISYYSSNEVQNALERLDNEGGTLKPSEENALSILPDNGVELEIDFDPPARPTQRFQSVPGGFLLGPTRSYDIDAGTLSQLLELQNQQWKRQGKRISILRLNKVNLLNDVNPIWARATRSLVNLQHVSARTCNILPNPWLDQLAHLPNLQSLFFCSVRGANDGNDDAVPKLTSLPVLTNFLHHRRDTLINLSVGDIGKPESDAQVESFCQAVQNCTALRRLDVNQRMGWKSAELAFFSNLIRANTSLEELHLILSHHTPSLVPMAHALAYNTSLHTLTVDGSTLDDDEDLPQQNYGSNDLQMDDPRANAEVFAFQEVLVAQNVTLRVLRLYRAEYDPLFPPNGPVLLSRWRPSLIQDKAQRAMQRVQFYLDLNLLGRRHFIRGNRGVVDMQNDKTMVTGERKDWVELLVDNRENTSVVFYFLHHHPSMYFEQ